MSATTEVQYFNSFLLKKVATGVGTVIDPLNPQVPLSGLV